MSVRRSRSGGTTQVDHVEPVEQILAERLLRDELAQVAVGRGDDADVDRGA